MIKKLLWVFLEKGLLTIIQFVSLVVLSRILGPEDYGVYGVMAIFIAVSDMLVDSGFSGAIVQKKDIGSTDINTLLFSNIIIGLVLYIILFFSAPAIEHYYEIPNLCSYIRILGISILVFALSQVQNAIIIRNLQFRKSAIINIVASIIALIAAIWIAKKGYGVWALIYQSLINSIVVTILMWLTTKTKIGLKVSKESFRFFWNFGSNVLAVNILDTIVNNITTSIIPKIDSLGKSGLYFQATKITNIPINIIGLSVDKFSFPVLSKEKDRVLFLEKARLMNRFLILIILPIFPLLSYCAFPVIQLVLGDNWIEVAPYFSVLILSGIFAFVSVLYRNMIKANGITKYLLQVGVIRSVVMLIGFIISAYFGVWAIIYCFVLMSLFGVLLWSICIKKVLGFEYVEQLSDIKQPFFALLIVLVILFIINIPEQSYIRFAVVFAAYFTYLLINYLIKNNELLTLIKRTKEFLFKL